MVLLQPVGGSKLLVVPVSDLLDLLLLLLDHTLEFLLVQQAVVDFEFLDREKRLRETLCLRRQLLQEKALDDDREELLAAVMVEGLVDDS